MSRLRALEDEIAAPAELRHDDSAYEPPSAVVTRIEGTDAVPGDGVGRSDQARVESEPMSMFETDRLHVPPVVILPPEHPTLTVAPTPTAAPAAEGLQRMPGPVHVPNRN